MQEIIFQDEAQQILDDRQAQLKVAEDTIERAARNAFEEWGAQLKNIRDYDLYRNAYGPGTTWEVYCQERWEKTSRWADGIIQDLEIANGLRKILNNSSDNQKVFSPSLASHVRPLAKLDKPEQRAEIWQRVAENANGRGITAKTVEAEVQRYKSELEKDWTTLTEWESLSGSEQQRLLTQSYPSKTFNNQTDNNIEWARWSWNPITGCLHNCAYCYARDIANRFYAQKFEPSFIPSRLNAPLNTKQPDFNLISDPVEKMGRRNVFVCSMADLFGKWVPEDWINAVLESIRRNPQWTFLLLTKFPVRMAEFEYPANVWLGTSVDYQWSVERAERAFTKIKASGFQGVCWLSCEPMMERLTFSSLDMFDWVVMGGASKSTQTPEFKPPFDWIVSLYTQARKANCKVYQKTNLIPGMADEQRIREYPNASK